MASRICILLLPGFTIQMVSGNIWSGTAKPGRIRKKSRWAFGWAATVPKVSARLTLTISNW